MEIVKTNLLNYCDTLDNFLIIHCISNDWALGAGIALQLKNKYKITKPNFETSVGTCVFSPTFIANLITKSRYWMKPSYDSLEASLKSLRRQLGNVDQQLQENKAINLSIATPKVNNILIKPNETFSFWHLIGPMDKKLGYKEGLTIATDSPSKGIGGGMCQFTNLIHWMILHSPLEIIEHHHHDNFDLFPDFGRQVPFGTGTSIVYNYLDYRFINKTPYTFQLITYTNDKYLCGELRCNHPLPYKYHIKCKDEFFSLEDGIVYRNNKIYRIIIDKITGKTIEEKLIKVNHAKVLYDTSNLIISKVINHQ